MKLEELDKNFAAEISGFEGLRFVNSRAKPFVTRGLLFDEKAGHYVRMPACAAAKVSPAVAELNKCTSGGRVRFKTDSGKAAIKCVMPSLRRMNHMAQTGISGFSLYADNVFYKSFIPPIGEPEGADKGYTAKIEFPLSWGKKMRDITVYFPLYNEVSDLFIGLENDCLILPPEEYTEKKPVLFYGSSITQGGCASRPGNSYDAILCRYLNADYINLGFSGNAKGEPAMAEYLGGLDVSLFVMDYDHNTPNADFLEKTHYPFYALYRDSRPDVPVVMVSRPDFYSWQAEDLLRREVVRAGYEKGKAGGDKNLYFVDGEKLFGTIHRDGCTVDGVHPNDNGFQRMADTLYETVKTIAPFSGRVS